MFLIFYPNPQLDQNFKPTRNLSGHFLYTFIYIYIWVWLFIYLNMKKYKGPFWWIAPPLPSNKIFWSKEKSRNLGLWKLFSSGDFRTTNPHTGCLSCGRQVVVCVMKGCRGKPVISMGLLKLFSSTHLVVTGELTHTVVPYAHTVVVYIVKREEGDPW